MAESISTSTPNLEMATPFQVNPFQMDQTPMFNQNLVPRYLFRVYSANSAGETSTTRVVPPASPCGKVENILFPRREGATRLLNNHLRWLYGHEEERNLMSWTSSLLYALQYGLYKNGGPREKTELSQIFLLVLDTRDFPSGTFIKDLEIMEVLAEPPEDKKSGNLRDLLQLRKSEKGYYFGEYLTQGEVNVRGKCVETSMQDLIAAGLFDIHPGLKNPEDWSQWANSVINLREPFRASPKVSPLTSIEVEKAISIARICFGTCWTIPMAAMLLALLPRKKNDNIILDVFAAEFTAAEVRQLNLETMKFDTERLPEVEQFKNLIGDGYRRFTGEDVLQISDIFANFRL